MPALNAQTIFNLPWTRDQNGNAILDVSGMSQEYQKGVLDLLHMGGFDAGMSQTASTPSIQIDAYLEPGRESLLNAQSFMSMKQAQDVLQLPWKKELSREQGKYVYRIEATDLSGYDRQQIVHKLEGCGITATEFEPSFSLGKKKAFIDIPITSDVGEANFSRIQRFLERKIEVTGPAPGMGNNRPGVAANMSQESGLYQKLAQGGKLNIAGYEAEYTPNSDYPFLSFEVPGRSSEQHYKGDGWKFHLSVDPVDVPRALDMLIPIMEKHGVQCFKVADPECARSFNQPNSGQAGKQFTIYGARNDPNFRWDVVIQEIETTFAQNNIKPSASQIAGDRMVPGSKYAGYRNEILRGPLKEVVMGAYEKGMRQADLDGVPRREAVNMPKYNPYDAHPDVPYMSARGIRALIQDGHVRPDMAHNPCGYQDHLQNVKLNTAPQPQARPVEQPQAKPAQPAPIAKPEIGNAEHCIAADMRSALGEKNVLAVRREGNNYVIDVPSTFSRQEFKKAGINVDQINRATTSEGLQKLGINPGPYTISEAIHHVVVPVDAMPANMRRDATVFARLDDAGVHPHQAYRHVSSTNGSVSCVIEVPVNSDLSGLARAGFDLKKLEYTDLGNGYRQISIGQAEATRVTQTPPTFESILAHKAMTGEVHHLPSNKGGISIAFTGSPEELLALQKEFSTRGITATYETNGSFAADVGKPILRIKTDQSVLVRNTYLPADYTPAGYQDTPASKNRYETTGAAGRYGTVGSDNPLTQDVGGDRHESRNRFGGGDGYEQRVPGGLSGAPGRAGGAQASGGGGANVTATSATGTVSGAATNGVPIKDAILSQFYTPDELKNYKINGRTIAQHFDYLNGPAVLQEANPVKVAALINDINNSIEPQRIQANSSIKPGSTYKSASTFNTQSGIGAEIVTKVNNVTTQYGWASNENAMRYTQAYDNVQAHLKQATLSTDGKSRVCIKTQSYAEARQLLVDMSTLGMPTILTESASNLHVSALGVDAAGNHQGPASWETVTVKPSSIEKAATLKDPRTGAPMQIGATPEFHQTTVSSVAKEVPAKSNATGPTVAEPKPVPPAPQTKDAYLTNAKTHLANAIPTTDVSLRAGSPVQIEVGSSREAMDLLESFRQQGIKDPGHLATNTEGLFVDAEGKPSGKVVVRLNESTVKEINAHPEKWGKQALGHTVAEEPQQERKSVRSPKGKDGAGLHGEVEHHDARNAPGFDENNPAQSSRNRPIPGSRRAGGGPDNAGGKAYRNAPPAAGSPTAPGATVPPAANANGTVVENPPANTSGKPPSATEPHNPAAPGKGPIIAKSAVGGANIAMGGYGLYHQYTSENYQQDMAAGGDRAKYAQNSLIANSAAVGTGVLSLASESKLLGPAGMVFVAVAGGYEAAAATERGDGHAAAQAYGTAAGAVTAGLIVMAVSAGLTTAAADGAMGAELGSAAGPEGTVIGGAGAAIGGFVVGTAVVVIGAQESGKAFDKLFGVQMQKANDEERRKIVEEQQKKLSGIAEKAERNQTLAQQYYEPYEKKLETINKQLEALAKTQSHTDVASYQNKKNALEQQKLKLTDEIQHVHKQHPLELFSPQEVAFVYNCRAILQKRYDEQRQQSQPTPEAVEFMRQTLNTVDHLAQKMSGQVQSAAAGTVHVDIPSKHTEWNRDMLPAYTGIQSQQAVRAEYAGHPDDLAGTAYREVFGMLPGSKRVATAAAYIDPKTLQDDALTILNEYKDKFMKGDPATRKAIAEELQKKWQEAQAKENQAATAAAGISRSMTGVSQHQIMHSYFQTGATGIPGQVLGIEQYSNASAWTGATPVKPISAAAYYSTMAILHRAGDMQEFLTHSSKTIQTNLAPDMGMIPTEHYSHSQGGTPSAPKEEAGKVFFTQNHDLADVAYREVFGLMQGSTNLVIDNDKIGLDKLAAGTKKIVNQYKEAFLSGHPSERLAIAAELKKQYDAAPTAIVGDPQNHQATKSELLNAMAILHRAADMQEVLNTGLLNVSNTKENIKNTGGNPANSALWTDIPVSIEPFRDSKDYYLYAVQSFQGGPSRFTHPTMSPGSTVTLSPAERQILDMPELKEKLGKVLGNKDGLVTLEEIKAVFPKGFNFRDLDKNHDGVIAKEEFMGSAPIQKAIKDHTKNGPKNGR